MARASQRLCEPVVTPTLELREPSSQTVCAGVAAEQLQKQRWSTLLNHPYPRKLQQALQHLDLAPLLEHVDHLGALLAAEHLCLKAARMRQETPEKIRLLERDVQTKAMQLRMLAAILTFGNRDLSTKLPVLTKVRDTLEREGISLASFDFFGDSYLHLACRSATTGQELSHLLQFFLQAGVDCNRADRGNNVPAHLLRYHENFMPALLTLLSQGANPNIQDGFGYTVMHRLAGAPNSQEALHLCAVAGGDLCAATERGETLLHVTLAQQDNPVTADFLVKSGVAPLARDHMGLSAVDYAETNNRTASRPFLGLSYRDVNAMPNVD